MTLMQYNWTFPGLEDSLHQMITTYKNSEELKEKLFYLSKFLNKDVLKQLCIMLHKITYVFANDVKYALKITNNKHQIELIPQKNIHSDFDSYYKNIIMNGPCNCLLLGDLKLNFQSETFGFQYQHTNFFVGFCIEDDIDVSDMQIKSDGGLSVILDKVFCKIGKYNLFKVNVPLYVLGALSLPNWTIVSPYTSDIILEKIKVCYILSNNLPISPPSFVIKMQNCFHAFFCGSFHIVNFDDDKLFNWLLRECNIDADQMPIGKVFLLKK